MNKFYSSKEILQENIELWNQHPPQPPSPLPPTVGTNLMAPNFYFLKVSCDSTSFLITADPDETVIQKNKIK